MRSVLHRPDSAARPETTTAGVSSETTMAARHAMLEPRTRLAKSLTGYVVGWHGLAPLSLSTIATLSGSHVCNCGRGAVAVSSLGSALAIAMMVGGGGAPPLAAWLGPDWIRAPGRAPS